ncbi:3526_t:CDS:2 [Diversispora eburnea]|uniref:3526_t:CDS:1 n=1 Tax=Diversispora eburnea TaxID=1213867 RepID=A0A9N9FID2_9GLOM|nr:3526_t:CDS:2 [Diversispora eburnea]
MSKKSKEESSWFFKSQEISITLSFTPFAALSFLALLLSLLIAYYKYTEILYYDIYVNDNDDKISWIKIANKYENEYIKNTDEENIPLDNGAFVYRHIYMDEFKSEFNIEPINFTIIDPSIADLIKNHNLTYRLRNKSKENSELIEEIFRYTKIYSSVVEDIKYKVGNGTYVDDRRVYVRWVDDFFRFGLFAGREFNKGDVIGVYAGIITLAAADNEYAWEFNYIVDVKDDNGEKIHVCVNAKNSGNYLRFANHLDNERNGDQIYIVYDDIWYILYIAQERIKPHEQIFVYYGSEYWADREKY